MSRIVIDARESGTSTGRYVDKLIEYLYKLRPVHEIIVLTKTHRLDYLRELAPDFTIQESPYKEFSFGEQLGFNGQLSGLRADLVHFSMTQQPLRYRGKTVTTIHDLTTLRFTNPAKNVAVFKFKQQVYRYVTINAAKKSSAVIVPSSFVKDDVAKFTGVDPSKLIVTYEAADQIIVPTIPTVELAKSRFILYVGRPTPHKNLERLVEAFQLLQKQQPDLKLALVGKQDNNYRRLEAFVRKQGVQNIVFIGFANDAKLRWLYENCQAYVFPSLSEGFGLPGLEAMAHGAPVVSSNATCLPEIYGEAVEYFDPLDVQAMSQAIQKVLTDPALRAGLIKKGAAQVKKYSWRRMAEQTLAVYEKALKI